MGNIARYLHLHVVLLLHLLLVHLLFEHLLFVLGLQVIVAAHAAILVHPTRAPTVHISAHVLFYSSKPDNQGCSLRP